MKITQYIGIVLGALYGVGFRLLCDRDVFGGFYDIYSITFIWLLPIVVGVIPILFSRKEVLESRWKQFSFPFFSVLLFFLFALSSGLEDWLCILIIAFPFLIGAGIVGLLLGAIIKKYKSNNLYSILLLPLVLSPLEMHLSNHYETFYVQSEININASNISVWDNIIEVPEIMEAEYNYGFFNYIGVPRPIRSTLERVKGVEYRIGHFTDSLKLYETISKSDSLKYVNFKIHMDKSELRNTPTDKHLLQSNNFEFKNISYSLTIINREETKLTLNCEYNINSKMNFYASFWANQVIKDFEERLLESLKLKIEYKR